MAARKKRRKSTTKRKTAKRRKSSKRRAHLNPFTGRMTKPRKKARTAAQKAATKKMIAANKKRRSGHHKPAAVLPHLPSFFRMSRAPTVRPRASHHGSHHPEARTVRLKPRSPVYHDFED